MVIIWNLSIMTTISWSVLSPNGFCLRTNRAEYRIWCGKHWGILKLMCERFIDWTVLWAD